jgi:CDP-glycerol glycerophosphotransferase
MSTADRLNRLRKQGRTFIRKVRKTAPIEWKAYTRTLPVQAGTVLYESFAGNGMLCNPHAIFVALLDDPRHRELKHVWALRDVSSPAATQYADHPRVSFVRYGSMAYYRALATSQYLFNNATFPADFGKRDGQCYVNTWHGTPLKHMGYDNRSGLPELRNVVRNFVMADYLVSANEFMTQRMYESAYRLHNIYPGRFIEEGYPRTDLQNGPDAARVRPRLRSLGVHVPDGARVILYAPTWRGESFYEPVNDALTLLRRVTQLKGQLEETDVVLLKVHQQVYAFAQNHPELRSILVPNDVPTNVVLGMTDVLITDYSSIFFDFLSTRRPIVFFMPDLRDYEGYRGTYLEPRDLPGPVVATVDELARVVRAAGTGEDADPLMVCRDAYSRAVERFAPWDDGAVCERVIDVVFNGRAEARRVRPAARDGRQSMAIHLGGMKSNGITTSVLNLLDNIDYSRFDVTVLYDHSERPGRWKNIAAINENARQFARIGNFSPGKRFRTARRQLLSQGLSAPRADRMRTLLQEEWHRCLGTCEFDYVIDFSGYGSFWSLLLSQQPAKSKAIWLHNDLWADRQREVDSRRPHWDNLTAVFSTYRRFDRLVSVSAALSEINRRKLADFADADKFVFARNTINQHRILSMAHGSPEQIEGWPGDHVLRDVHDVPEALDLLIESLNLESMREEVERRASMALVPRREDTFTFVTVGRLSPEKNQERLVRAFDLVHQQLPQTQLIVVGDGPLREDLERLSVQLGLGGAVIFTGLQPNPYAIMAQCDCFVLSSDYEGQPMVLLEARVLGLAIVATAFDSVAGALPPGVGLVVERDVEALAQGLLAAADRQVPNPVFDADTYNREVMAEFYAAVGVTADVVTDPR